MTVANAARLVASRIAALDPEKAYMYGMMHDVGKFYLPANEAYKHPRIGFKLLETKHNDIAEICVSHAFPDFSDLEHILSYCHGDKPEAHAVCELLSNIKHDLYIDLIQFCDKVSGIGTYMTIEAKYDWYIERDIMIQNDVTLRYLETLQSIKKKLDKLVGYDLYALIGASQNSKEPVRKKVHVDGRGCSLQ
jgi:hypothetical protein